MKDVASWVLNAAALRGASYADARIVDERSRALSTKNGKVSSASDAESLGIGIRAIADGAWGFAASDDLSRAAVEAAAARAVEIAKSSAQVKQHDVTLAPEKPATAEWTTPCKIDPFTISVEQNIALLLKVDSELRSVAGVTLAETNMNFRREEQWFLSSEGANIHQTKYSTGVGYAAYAFAGNEIQKRSYPTSYGGQWQNKGYELIEELKLVENARRVGEEAVALLKADKCPEGVFTIILESAQLGLQIHESIGHPIELDRVLGMEANFAGTSFLTLDKLHKLRYGSDLVNVVADARQEHGPGLGTFGYDDEGVPAQCTPIITNGLFTGYLSSRETAHLVGLNRSGGTLRAEGWNRLPIIRMTNISILPGEKPLTLEQLIGDTGQGIFMQTNRSWSIDDKRYNFQFGCEAGWEIKNGKRGRMLKNTSYSGIT
ncbi:MAG TPA: TldD/PmbA family protein, partial [Terriglobales bacterium]